MTIHELLDEYNPADDDVRWTRDRGDRLESVIPDEGHLRDELPADGGDP